MSTRCSITGTRTAPPEEDLVVPENPPTLDYATPQKRRPNRRLVAAIKAVLLVILWLVVLAMLIIDHF
jgi:hypothetical protein